MLEAVTKSRNVQSAAVVSSASAWAVSTNAPAQGREEGAVYRLAKGRGGAFE